MNPSQQTPNHQRISTASETDPAALAAFLDRMYPPAKSAFIQQHGDWWHGGAQNRWVLLVDGVVAGYCAIIPTLAALHGEAVPAIWWVDLVIDPAYRGQGLQRLFDERVRSLAELKLGFPNAAAAAIHRKHNWGVREDFHALLLPLRPPQMRLFRDGLVRRAAGLAFAPLAAAWRFYLRKNSASKSQNLRLSSRIEPGSLLNPEALAAVAAAHPPGVPTTLRTADYLRWRFFDAPYANQLTYYAGYTAPAEPSLLTAALPDIVLVVRTLERAGRREVRILDVFGRLDGSPQIQRALAAALRLAASDAARAGAVQVTALVSLPTLLPAFRAAGFWLRSVGRFCWHTTNSAHYATLAGPSHWALADSDNDEPVL